MHAARIGEQYVFSNTEKGFKAKKDHEPDSFSVYYYGNGISDQQSDEPDSDIDGGGSFPENIPCRRYDTVRVCNRW